MSYSQNNWEQFYSLDTTPSFFLNNICVHKSFLEAIINQDPKQILEVGVGTGTMSIFLSLLGIECTGADSNKEIVKKAEILNKKLNGRAVFKKADAFYLSFSDHSFDVVFSQGFFEHFADVLILKLLREQLRVGKIVMLSVPNNFYPQKDFGDERLLSKLYWDTLLKTHFNLLHSENYYEFSKEADGLWGKKTERFLVMYMAKISL
ncbi:MAG: class I SAM-dependent methyltransferase [Candidatus Ryanbacteria bacterium]|nr:class I SAM-dependent methyltransferase [Candidatus Ryanbacteria bacterium]